MKIKQIFKYIFHHKEYKEEQKRLAKEAVLDSKVDECLAELSKCKTFTDLLCFHKYIVRIGFDFTTDHSWNFGNKPIEYVSLYDLIFTAYDRDSCIHGKDLEYLEEHSDNLDEWFNWSYWISWSWYYKTLYKRIKYHRNPIQLSPDILVPCPPAVTNFFH